MQKDLTKPPGINESTAPVLLAEIGNRGQLNPEQHSRNFLSFHPFSQPKRKRILHFVRIHKRSKHPIPNTESRPEIFPPVQRRRMVNTMIRRRNNQPRQRPNVYLEIRVLPELNQQSQRITNPSLRRTKLEQRYRDDHLRNIVNE